MGKKLKKVKVFVKEHKKVLAICGGVALTAVGVVILKNKMPKYSSILDPKILGEGNYERLINDGVVNIQKWSGKDGGYDIWIDEGLPLMCDLKTLADDLCDIVPDITPSNRVSGVLFISDKKGIKFD